MTAGSYRRMPGGLAMGAAGGEDRVERGEVGRVAELPRNAERMREVGRPDEQDVGAGQRGDGIGVGDGRGVLDLEDADGDVVERPDLGVAARPKPCATVARAIPRWPAGGKRMHAAPRATWSAVSTRGTMSPPAPMSRARETRSRSPARCGRGRSRRSSRWRGAGQEVASELIPCSVSTTSQSKPAWPADLGGARANVEARSRSVSPPRTRSRRVVMRG